MNAFILLSALAAPLLLLPLEKVIPAPHLMEELVKMVLVVWLIRGETRRAPPQWGMALAIGGLFALSETILYLNNFLFLGSGAGFVTRLLLTGSLHLGSTLILYGTLRKSWIWGTLGLFLVMALHYVFNLSLGLKL